MASLKRQDRKDLVAVAVAAPVVALFAIGLVALAVMLVRTSITPGS